MLPFANDYSRGAHPKVLQALVDTNMDAQPGYGQDDYTKRAAEKIKTACQMPEAEVFFISGGTQTNQVVISNLLDGDEGVVAADSGHINFHEAGSIEYTGHKVLTLPGVDGKVTANNLQTYLDDWQADENHGQMVAPGMVYISYATEVGTLYSKQELADLSKVCRANQLTLFMDGARLGYALMSPENELSLADIATYCDVFYIGGTKVGALAGEAVVFTHQNVPMRFTTKIKRQGAMLAKGRLIGVQFDALFTDNLYFKISQHAIVLAMKLKQALKDKGYQFLIDSPTNQQFVVVNNSQLEKLKKQVDFSFWEIVDSTHTAIRFVTSWSTTEDEVAALIAIL
ncbi:aminotransferase class V-fold PLP-dependent enzyme [Lactobacillus sp. LC28-10]|uniref:Aminotransferase class V-fold PLP-dependent enzyme n=1 Tax=Secundilactobacillus angelensis TaxID=2722706 RepID=A0ABX1L1T8_9LACO|nr:aminotransferase class I/II-fold pyridoxal phosphate-dependent enzyme [Secundilactobacillus angelensis]MCH5463356.1 aminotransferase class I/II-fold pyridoxal phosphate-dependent enzyme [Secundilactobacillus angelensis]NLR19389.1 aminotransferase class V-fold PLP-dependent enzyme [Secundilactobacillus angelensis]